MNMGQSITVICIFRKFVVPVAKIEGEQFDSIMKARRDSDWEYIRYLIIFEAVMSIKIL